MRAVWRLATSSLRQRPSRTLLLIAVVALSSALIAAVGSAIASLNRALEARVTSMVGDADVIVQASTAGQYIDATIETTVRARPEVASTRPVLETSLPLRHARAVWESGGAPPFRRELSTLIVAPFVVALPAGSPPLGVSLLDGRWATGPGEIVLDSAAMARLNDPELSIASVPPIWTLAAPPPDVGPLPGPEEVADRAQAGALNASTRLAVGGTVEALRLGGTPVKLRVVGVSTIPALGGRPQGYATISALEAVTGRPGKITRVDVGLVRGVEPGPVIASIGRSLPQGAIARASERVSGGLERSMRSTQLGLVLASIMAFLAASFIIVTGLTTGVSERQREMAILRCIGASRGTIVASQLMLGAIVGVLGGIVGVPLGIGAAGALITVLHEYIATGFTASAFGVSIAFGGAVAVGLAGASVPGVLAARVSPLRALSPRAIPARPRTMVVITLAGLACLAAHLGAVSIPKDGQVVFWCVTTFGLPMMYGGYFLLGVGAVWCATRVIAGPVGRVLRLPARILARSMERAPYRHGFTAGAMMSGLGLLVALWTQGGSILRDWIGKLEFPEAFVVGVNLSRESQAALEAMPFVDRTCAIALHPVAVKGLGVASLQKFQTTFIAFEPDPFLAMTNLEWVEGNPTDALRRLNEGGAVLVAKEFRTAQGMGVGDTFRCTDRGRELSFEIVGVVTSPGLEIVSKFFNVGTDYTEQALHAVFGSRRDLHEKFASDAIHMIQIGLKDPGEPGYLADDEAVARIRRELAGAGVIDAGSGRQVMSTIRQWARSGLLGASSIAFMAMFIACLGVANVVIAGISARKFEFGVLRAVGAPASMLARLVLGEALIVGVGACVLGTFLGFQGAYTGRSIDRLLFGLDLHFQPPYIPIAVGWVVVIAMTLGAATPAVLALVRRPIRELLLGPRE